MHVINYPDIDDEIQFMYFPGGEPHAKVPTITDVEVLIIYRGASWGDFGSLLVLLDALSWQKKIVTLAIPYFPGARQDRNPGGNTPLTVDMYAKLLSPYVDNVIVADIHSITAMDIIQQELGTVEHITVGDIFAFYSHTFHDIDYIIAPDKGAVDRAIEISELLDVPVIYCEKKREFETGRILSYEFMGDVVPGRYLVVDDICDGGATFVLLAESFYNKVPREITLSSCAQDRDLYQIDLYVTHPIFSKGFNDLFRFYRKIYFTDSRDIYVDESDDHILMLPISPVINAKVAENA
jgi:ribose-phosphate pyrophosphokinase